MNPHSRYHQARYACAVEAHNARGWRAAAWRIVRWMLGAAR